MYINKIVTRVAPSGGYFPAASVPSRFISYAIGFLYSLGKLFAKGTNVRRITNHFQDHLSFRTASQLCFFPVYDLNIF